MGIFDVTRAAFQHTTLFDNDPKRDWDFVALKAREVLEKAQRLEDDGCPKQFARRLLDGAEQLAQAVDELAATEAARRANK